MFSIPENNRPSDGYFSPEFVEKAPSSETFIERALLSLRKEAIAQIQRGALGYSASIEPRIGQIIDSLKNKSFHNSLAPQTLVDQLGFFLLDLENPKKSSDELLKTFHELPENAHSFLKNSIPKNLETQFEKDPKILLQLVNHEGITPIEHLMEIVDKGIPIDKSLTIPIFNFRQEPLIKGYDAFVQKVYEKIAADLCKGKNEEQMLSFVLSFVLNTTNSRLKTEIVKFYVPINSPEIAKYIQIFDIKDEADRLEIAKLCAKNTPYSTAQHFQNFNIQNEASVLEIAELCAQDRYDYGMLEWAQNFNLQNEASRLKIAKLCAKNAPDSIARYIKKFNITNQVDLVEIAKECAQNNSLETAQYIQNFNLQDEASRIEIAKLCVKNNGVKIAQYIQNFNITNQAELLEIAKKCAQNNVYTTAQYIQNFKFQDEASVLEIAKICAKKNAMATTEYIQEFNIQNKAARLEIAKLCAENNGLSIVINYNNFNINNHNKIIELFKISIDTSVEAAHYILEHSFNDFSKKSSWKDLKDFSVEKLIISGALSKEGEDAKRFQKIKQFVDEKIANNEELKKFLRENPSDISYIKIYIITKKLDSNLAYELTEYFISAMNFRNASLSITMLRELCALVSQNKIETYKELASIVPLRLPMIFIAKWSSNSNESKDLQICLKHLREDLKNAKKNLMQRWLMVCQALDQSPIVKKIDLLNWVCSQLPDGKSKAQNLINRLSYLYILCKEDSEALAKRPQESLPEEYLEGQLTNLIEKDTYLNLSNVENIAEKYVKTLDTMRIPYAWKIYEESLKSTDDPEIQTTFRKLIINILNNEMPGARYALCGDHIKHIATSHPRVWENWQQTVTSQQVFLDSSLEPVNFNFRNFLTDKKKQNHLNNGPDSLEELIEFLENPSPENAAYIECEKAPSGSLKGAQFLLMKLYLDPKASQKIIQNDKWNDLVFPLENFELHNDLVGLKTTLTKAVNSKTKLLLVDTDDWQDAMLCGTEVVGSCQRIDGKPDLNKCLLAYIIDGKNRILALKDPLTGKIVARSIFRLLLNKKNQPVLFQDRLYPTPLPPAFAEALHSFAKQRARELGLPLYTLEMRQDTEKSEDQLVSLRSPAPFEYEDAAEGIMPKGIFTIKDVRQVSL